MITIVLLVITILVLSGVLLIIKIGQPVSNTTQAPASDTLPKLPFTPTDYQADIYLYSLTSEKEDIFSPGTVDILLAFESTPAYLDRFCSVNPAYTSVYADSSALSFLYNKEKYTPIFTRSIDFSSPSQCTYTFLREEKGYIAVFACDIQNQADAERLCYTLLCYRDYFPVIVSGTLSDEAQELVRTVCRLEDVSKDRLLLTQNTALNVSDDPNAFPLMRKEAPRKLDPEKKMLALTYDDGPSAVYTPLVLDALEKYNVKATFFVLGCHIRPNAKLIERAFSLGCEIGNHTNLHESFSQNTPSIIRKSLEVTNSALRQITGIGAPVVRPPGGEWKDRNGRDLSVGYPIFLWNIDTFDYENGKTADDVLNSVSASLAHGSIVLMHDIHAPSAEAADRLLALLIEQGYQLVSASELLEFAGNGSQNDKIYTNSRK